VARRFLSFLKILLHQSQYCLRHRLPRSRVRNSRDLLRHIHRLGGQVHCAFSVDIERFQRRPAGQHQQLVRVNPPVIRQQDTHRYIRAITGADVADGLKYYTDSTLSILYPFLRVPVDAANSTGPLGIGECLRLGKLNKKPPRMIEGASFWRREWDSNSR
jgi:hypothetical protein